MLKYVVACVVAAGLCLAANQSRSSTETPRGAQPATRPAYTLDQLAWLAGRWEGELSGERMEEHWSAAEGGLMMGMFRLMSRDGQTRMLELETLRQTATGVELRFRHFAPDLEPREEKGQTPTVILTELTEQRVVFEPPPAAEQRPGTPRRLIMLRSTPDLYRVQVIVMRDGEEKLLFEAELRRVNAVSPGAVRAIFKGRAAIRENGRYWT